MSTQNDSPTASIDGSLTHDASCSSPLSSAPPLVLGKNKPETAAKKAAPSADTFPAKTHHLVAHLTETDPQVVTFSPDGTAFYIYDQLQLAHKYLPKYFKHSNYGSFVRQLNLYGFTSSRLKWNSDVVSWTHPCFHRDKRQDLCNIKRSKKAKASSTPKTIPREVPRPSSTPVSEDADSISLSFRVNNDHKDVHENFNHEEQDGSRKFSMDTTQESFHLHKKDGVYNIKRSTNTSKVESNAKPVPEVPRPSSTPFSEDAESSSPSFQASKSHNRFHGNGYHEAHDYLRSISTEIQSEFAYLKQQNRFLEEKLDILLKITLNVDGSGGIRSGEKRRKFDVPYAHRRRMEYAYPAHHHYDECKYSDDARFSSSRHYEESKYSEDPPCHCNRYEPLSYRTNENFPSYRSELPYRKKAVAESIPVRHRKTDTFSEFIDVMMTDETKDCALSDNHVCGQENIWGEPQLRSVTIKQAQEVSLQDESKQEAEVFIHDDLEDEALNEAIGHILQRTHSEDRDLFTQSFDTNDDIPMSSYQGGCNAQASGFRTMSNRIIDKSSGPEAVFSTDIVTGYTGDVEEGNMPVGVAVISAEVVQDELNLISESDHQALQQELDRERQKKKQRRRMIYFLSFIVVVLICVFVTWPLVVIGKHNQMENAELIAETATINSSEDSDSIIPNENGLFDNSLSNQSIVDYDSFGQDNLRAKGHNQSSVTRHGAILAMPQNESLFVQDTSTQASFSVTIAGAEFSCSQNIPR